MAELKRSKHERFCREYSIDSNGTQAAIRAGYSARTAASISHELLRKPEIKARTAELCADRNRRCDVSAERVLQELARVAFANMGDYLVEKADGDLDVDFSNATHDQMAAVAEMTAEVLTRSAADGTCTSLKVRIRVKMHNKLQALIKLGERMDLWRSNEDKTPDALSALLNEINSRGSAAPFVRH